MSAGVAVVILNRNLRTQDNETLFNAAKSGLPVLVCFNFTPEQIDPVKNRYFSPNAMQFMLETLRELNGEIKIHFFYGAVADALDKIGAVCDIKEVHTCMDYTPYAKRREAEIRRWCQRAKETTFTLHDEIGLVPINAGLLGSGEAYQKFTPFYVNATYSVKVAPVRGTINNLQQKVFRGQIPGEIELETIRSRYHTNESIAFRGGRREALKRLANITPGNFKSYDTLRNFPAKSATTGLSPYIKFGCVSIREVYWRIYKKLGKGHGLIRELYWQSFYQHITYYHPKVLGHAMKPAYDAIPWSYSKTDFRRWCDGVTGFPLVDAAMRCLEATGWMHNRLRMVVAMFLTKDLLIDWRWGEHWFATKLVDYDVMSNNGGWQWCASTGADGVPYFRVFNPWLQSKRFDPDAEFIKRWVPELASVPAKDVHRWDIVCKSIQYMSIDYHEPMVEHSVAAKAAIEVFKNNNSEQA